MLRYLKNTKFSFVASKRYLSSLQLDNDYYDDIEIRYNKQDKYFFEVHIPKEAIGSKCYLCKGSGWIINKNNIKDDKKNNMKNTPLNMLDYDLCYLCNGSGIL